MRLKRQRRRKVLPRSPFRHANRKVSTGKRRCLEEMKHMELEHLLDAEVSFHVRASAALQLDCGGMIPCYTCGRMHHWKSMDAGHYIGRSNRGVRWDLRNIRPQGTRCNSYQEGMHWQFRVKLVAEIGAAEVEDLERTAGQWGESRRDRLWLIEQIKDWREKNAKLRMTVR